MIVTGCYTQQRKKQ